MANENEGPPLWFWIVIAVAAFLFGLGIIVAAVKVAVGTAPIWVLFISRLVLIGLSTVAAAILAIRSASWAFTKAVDEVTALEARHPKQLAQAKQRAPTFVAIALLVSEAIVIIADNSFEGKTVATLVVSFVMLLGFGLANGLMVKAGWIPWSVGLILWFLMLGFLPGAIMVDRRWGVRELGKHLWSLPMPTKLFFALAALVMLVMPVLMARINDAQQVVGPERG
jgi:hypothetical protein